MRRSADIQKITSPDWLSFSIEQWPRGYSIYETANRFMRERLAERMLCAVGMVAVLTGVLVWFLPQASTWQNPTATRLCLSVICIGTGTALYFFASRGFRQMIHVDLSERRISFGHVNTKNKSLFGYNYAMDEIESMYVRRGVSDAGPASLHIRIAGKPVSLRLLHGLQDELEDLHTILCRDIHTALDCAPRRVSQPSNSGVAPKTPRPGKRRKPSKRYVVAVPASQKQRLREQRAQPKPTLVEPLLIEEEDLKSVRA